MDIHKERIESLISDNHKLMTTVSVLKRELNQVKTELESIYKCIKMLNSETNDIDKISHQEKKVGGLKGLETLKQREEFMINHF